MAVLKSLYETFLQERRFLRNCSPKTLGSYGQAWDAFESVLIPLTSAEEVRAAIKDGIVLFRFSVKWSCGVPPLASDSAPSGRGFSRHKGLPIRCVFGESAKGELPRSTSSR